MYRKMEKECQLQACLHYDLQMRFPIELWKTSQNAVPLGLLELMFSETEWQLLTFNRNVFIMIKMILFAYK